MKLHDSVAEMQIIKTVCDTKDKVKRAFILKKLKPKSFGEESARKIYERLLILTQNAKDIPSSKVLAVDDSLDDASKALIANPAHQELDTAADIERSIEIIEGHHKSRMLFEVLGASLDKMRNERPDMPALLSELDDVMQKCAPEDSEEEIEHYNKANAKEICREVERDLAEKSPEDFLPTGLHDFDKRTGGLRRKNVLVIASVPGGGKSTLALQIARNQYMMGFNVCYVSIEMDKIELRYRLLSSTSQINHGNINLKRLNKKQIKHVGNEFYKFLTDVAGEKENNLSVFCPREEKSINDIVRDVRHMECDCIIIDYIGLLKDNSKQQLHEALGEHAKQAKIAANKLNCVMIILAQYDSEGNKIKYSKAVEAHANFIWAWDHGEKEKESGIIKVRQLKARSAEEYDFHLLKDFGVCSFRDHIGPVPEEKEEDEGKKKGRKKASENDGEGKKSIPKMPQLV
jgi:replicative DNA helicase